MVLLFTDGAIRATRNGRTNEISEQEVDAFAAFAQNNGVVVNTLHQPLIAGGQGGGPICRIREFLNENCK